MDPGNALTGGDLAWFHLFGPIVLHELANGGTPAAARTPRLCLRQPALINDYGATAPRAGPRPWVDR